ncbi:MAG: DNA integrity scanning protein DisA nucleotide-binding domain protein [Candidatus Tectomicrobia bacterium]|nr:DNA integrity scanning protein DisA nucleotide-binding domain protein [Candidatus Tectomicrobia bacterium]
MDGALEGGILARIPWSQLADIGIMWFLVYQVYARFQGTQAMRLLVRVFLVWLASLAAQSAGLVLTSFLLWALWLAALLLFLVNFQGEIRRIVMQLRPVSRLAVLLRRARRVGLPEENVQAVAQSAFALAQRGTGAIFILERRDPVIPLLRSPGEQIGAEIRSSLLETIFAYGAPYHDGAVIIRDGRVHQVGCVLPLSENAALPALYGTRHRAAVGISEASDALAVVVSEQRREVSAVEDGRIKAVETPEELASWLSARLRARAESPGKGRALREAVVENWRPKAATLAAVCALWLVGAYQRESPRNIFNRIGPGAEEGYSVPVTYYNLAEGLSLGEVPPERVQVRLRARQAILNFLDPGRLRVNVNLAGRAEGPARIALSARNVDLPGEIRLLEIQPSELSLRIVRRKAPRALPAKP